MGYSFILTYGYYAKRGQREKMTETGSRKPGEAKTTSVAVMELL